MTQMSAFESKSLKIGRNELYFFLLPCFSFRDALPIFFHQGNTSSLSVNYLPVGNLSLLVVVTDMRGGMLDVMDEESLVVSVSTSIVL